MLTSFSTALSALDANETAIDVVGNNLANMNTPGFKTSTLEFSDLVSQNIGSGQGDTQVGFGVGTPKTARQFTQGTMQPNSGPLTAAIQGDGFFVFQNANGAQHYSRVGNFKIDLKGNLVTSTGEQVVGWNAVNGVLNTNATAGAINLPAASQLPPKTTTTVSMDLNLNNLASPLPATDARNTFQTPIEVVDSKGQKHELTATFTKTGANTWNYNVSMAASEGTCASTGTLTFDANGKLTAPTPASATIALTGLTDAAGPMNVTWNFMNADGTAKFTQYAGDSSQSSPYQDGYTASNLSGISIGDGGAVIATYENGQQLSLAQLAVAGIRNPDTLIGAGNNEFSASSKTATPSVGVAGAGARGLIIGGSLEGSTVDIAKEFTNLILYQRGYQVNSRVITTANEISQEVLNLTH